MPRVLRNHRLPFPPVPAHECCEDEDLCGALFFPPTPLPGISCNANILRFSNKSAYFKIDQSVLVRRYDPASVSWSASVVGQVRRSRIIPVSSGWFGRIYTVAITCPHCGEEVLDNFTAYHGEIMDPDTNPYDLPQKNLVYARIPGETQGMAPSTSIWVPSTLLSSETQAAPHRICVMMGPPSLIGQECLVSEISPYEPLTVKVRTWSEDVVFGDGGGMDPLYSEALLARISARPDTEAQLRMMASIALLEMSTQARLGVARL